MSADPVICRLPECDQVAVTSRRLCAEHTTRAFSEHMRTQAVQLRSQGVPIAVIATRYGVGVKWAKRWLGEAPKVEKNPAVDSPIPHGSPSGWVYHKCMCAVCLEAKRQYKRGEHAKRLERPVNESMHGTRAGYTYGCRCEKCRGAVVDFLAQRQAASKATATNHRRAWTEQDAAVALDTSITIDERARRLGRTYSAVDNFLRKHNRQNPA